MRYRQQLIQSRVKVDLFWEKKDEINQIHYRMLREFDKFCRDHDIDYWLEGGSLIGAYFHQGIIPWDDDLDLAMTRSSWEKLEQLVPTWDDMVLQTYGQDKYFNSVKFHKLRDKTSYLNDGRFWSSASNEYQGLFIDIFVYDDTSYSSYEEAPASHKKDVNLQLRCRQFYELFHIFPFEAWNRKRLEQLTRVSETDKYMRLDYRCTTKDNKHYFLKKSQIFPLQRVKFGDNYYLAPRDIEGYLAKQYGNLVKYPPKEKQVPAHIIEYYKIK
ncbi:phosphorylcholine transferase LicD [Streptococcus sp. sy004]|uniref:LicD family protein n=1 Tax=Streptococcus sp. sy004 TaxID=2600149 RepID=UPI001645751F|nr:LicD family protein [Streptococcus sp. sy004]